MRNLFLYGPFLWLRRVVLWVLILVLLLVFVIYLIGNSSIAVKKAVEAYAPDYNISYDAISGNMFSGFEIDNPRYNNEPIAKEMVLKWNPNTLAKKQLTVSKLHLKEVNVEAVKSLLSQFGSNSNHSQEENKTTKPLDFRVEIEDIALSTKAFEMEGISVSSAMLQTNTIVYNNNTLEIDDFNLSVESNISDISVVGAYRNQVVSLKDIKLLDINLTAIMAMAGAENNSSSVEAKSTQNKTQTTSNTLMPKSVKIERAKVTLLPYNYAPVEISRASLQGYNLQYDVASKVLQKVNLELNSSTNLSELYYDGKIENNVLLGKLILNPNEALYTYYNIPLRKEGIAQIHANIHASKDSVMADIHTKGKEILNAKEGAFNLDIDSFDSHVVYTIASAEVTAETKASVTTPYSKNMRLTNQLTYSEGLVHHGQIHLAQIEGVDAKLVQPLENLVIDYHGDESSIKTIFKSKQIKGYFNSIDFKTAQAHVETDGEIALAPLLTLPPELQDAKAKVVIDAPLNLKDFSNMNAKVKVNSNIVNMDANVTYTEAINIDGTIVIPKDSLVKSYSQDVAWETLTPIDTQLRLKGNQLTLGLDAEALHSNLQYNLDTGVAQGQVDVAGLGIDIDGSLNEKLRIKTKVRSVKSLGEKLNKLYAIGELPPIEGPIDAVVNVDKVNGLELLIKAPKLIYKADKTTKHTIKDVMLSVSMKENSLLVKSYNVVFNKQKYYSTKTARITLGDTINISNFWLNDELKVEGDYIPKNKRGNFTAKAKSFHIKDKVADIYSKIDIKAALDGNDTRIEGKIVLLEGVITPQTSGRSFETDSDIIIIQEMQKNKKSPFMDNLALMLKIETQKPLRVKQEGLSVKLKPDFTINKEKGSEILYLGSVDLLEGGTYIFQEKRFVLAPSAVYFTGDVNKPLLDIKAKYQSLNYLITIAVTGTPAEPNINFSSNPSLTREQILSVILFDSEAGGDTHSGTEMMRMMGGAMAKAALSDVGVKVDHLAFGEGNSIEVGKKISSKTTVIYINGEIPKVKLKYQHNKRTESVIGVSEESQSYDIIYKRDF